MFNFDTVLKNCRQNSDLHKDDNSIPEEYRNYSLHIALERADMKKDWDSFRKIYMKSPDFLKNHLKQTGIIFDYNYQNLKKEERDLIFSL